MYYASIGVIALIVLVIINIEALRKVKKTSGNDEYIKKGCSMICRLFDHSPVFRIGGDEFVQS